MEKHYRLDGNYYAVIPVEIDGKTVYNVGEFSNWGLNKSNPIYVYELQLPTIRFATNVCEAMVEVFKDGHWAVV